MTSSRKTAFVAGVLYLLTFVSIPILTLVTAVVRADLEQTRTETRQMVALAQQTRPIDC